MKGNDATLKNITKGNQITQVIVHLRLDRPINGRLTKGKDLRGAIANLYPEKRLLHQHREDGKVDYHYPLVQYKIVKGKCLIVGFCEGAKLLSNIDLVMKTLLLAGEEYKILAKELEINNTSIEITETLQRYRFITPWLALNQKNYQEYRSFSMAEKRNKLDSLLRSHLLMTAKGLGVWFDKQVYTAINQTKNCSVLFKEQGLIGVYGVLLTNVQLPELIGIGQATSHGFGTIKKI